MKIVPRLASLILLPILSRRRRLQRANSHRNPCRSGLRMSK
jgi:hypothetical protein